MCRKFAEGMKEGRAQVALFKWHSRFNAQHMVTQTELKLASLNGDLGDWPACIWDSYLP